MSLYEVDLWGSDPDQGNDDCFSSLSFKTKEEALECFNNPAKFFPPNIMFGAVFVAYDWDESFDKRRVLSEAEEVDYRFQMAQQEAAYDRACQQEIAMQAGMGGGCSCYNDAMGWELDEGDYREGDTNEYQAL